MPGRPVIRALLSPISFVVATILGSVGRARSAASFDRTGDLVLALARLWSRVVLGVPGVKLEVEDARAARSRAAPTSSWPTTRRWSTSGRCSSRFRHRSVSLPRSSWPASRCSAGRWRAGRFIFIDRQNAVAARRSMEEAARRIRSGQSVVIFPEGTRTRDGRLGPFKKGGFHLAIDSGADIVPVAIRGSREVMPRGVGADPRRARSRVEVGEPIPTAGLGPGDREALIAKVRARVAEMLGEPAEPAARVALSKSREAASGRRGGAVMPPAVRSPVASMRATASSGMRPRPTSTSVPTRMRTMFLRKAVASMSKVSSGALAVDVQAAHDPARRACDRSRRRGRRGSRARRPAPRRRARMASMSSGSRTCQAVRAQPRRADEVVPDRVAVDLAARREAGVEVGRRLGDVDDRDVGAAGSS